MKEFSFNRFFDPCFNTRLPDFEMIQKNVGKKYENENL